MVMQVTMVILVYYFDKRLARANGIASSAFGLALFIIPPLAQLLIDYYGWQGALLILAGLIANSGVGAATFRPSQMELEIQQKLNNKKYNEEKQYMELQLGEKSAHADERKHDINQNHGDKNKPYDQKDKSNSLCSFLFDFELLKHLKCILLLMTFFYFALGTTMGTIFIPARANNVGISADWAAILVSIQGATSTMARFTHGYILDYKIMSPASLTATANVLSGLCCILNPVCDKYVYLATISGVFGFSSGVTNSIMAVISKDLVGTEKLSEVLAFILVMFGMGTLAGSFMTGKNLFPYFIYFHIKKPYIKIHTNKTLWRSRLKASKAC